MDYWAYQQQFHHQRRPLDDPALYNHPYQRPYGQYPHYPQQLPQFHREFLPYHSHWPPHHLHNQHLHPMVQMAYSGGRWDTRAFEGGLRGPWYDGPAPTYSISRGRGGGRPSPPHSAALVARNSAKASKKRPATSVSASPSASSQVSAAQDSAKASKKRPATSVSASTSTSPQVSAAPATCISGIASKNGPDTSVSAVTSSLIPEATATQKSDVASIKGQATSVPVSTSSQILAAPANPATQKSAVASIKGPATSVPVSTSSQIPAAPATPATQKSAVASIKGSATSVPVSTSSQVPAAPATQKSTVASVKGPANSVPVSTSSQIPAAPATPATQKSAVASIKGSATSVPVSTSSQVPAAPATEKSTVASIKGPASSVPVSTSSQVPAAPATQNSAVASIKGPATSVPESTSSQVPAAPVRLPERTTWCELCKLECSSLRCFQLHKTGKRHKKMLQTCKQSFKEKKIATGKQSVQTNLKSGSKNFLVDKLEDLKGKILRQEVLPSLAGTDDKSKEPVQQQGTLKNSLASTVSSAGSKRKLSDQIEPIGSDSKRNKKGQVQQSESKKTNQGPKKPVKPPKLKDNFPCKLCNVECFSQGTLEEHYLGKKHKAKLNKLNGDQGLHGKTGPQVQATLPSNCNSASVSDNPQLQQDAVQLQKGNATQPKQVGTAQTKQVVIGDRDAQTPFANKDQTSLTRLEVGSRDLVSGESECQQRSVIVISDDEAPEYAETNTRVENDSKDQTSLARLEVGSGDLVLGESKCQQRSVVVVVSSDDEAPESAETNTRLENDEPECFLEDYSVTIPSDSAVWEFIEVLSSAILKKRLSEAATLNQVNDSMAINGGGTNTRLENDERESNEEDLCVPLENLATTTSESEAMEVVEVLHSAVLKKCGFEPEYEAIDKMTSNRVEEDMEEDPEEDPEEDSEEEDPEEDPEEMETEFIY